MKRFLIIFISLIPVFLQAQDFNQAIGLRGGLSSGFEYRFYTNDANSYKFLLSTRNHGVQLHALREFHQYDLFEFTDQLVFVFGGGVHAGFESWDVARYQGNTRWYDTQTGILAGVDGLAGVEYIFYEVPISAGIEVKPYLDIFGKSLLHLQPFDFAFTVKYLF
ncbi:MAG: hypothetical protein J7L95_05905 [Prolixibacteraceae bacterium]|nr:hypothetical protein [Prolixibacteraceae bacterium]